MRKNGEGEDPKWQWRCWHTTSDNVLPRIFVFVTGDVCEHIVPIHRQWLLPGAQSFTFPTLNVFEHIELPAKLLDYLLWSNKSNINQSSQEKAFQNINKEVKFGNQTYRFHSFTFFCFALLFLPSLLLSSYFFHPPFRCSSSLFSFHVAFFFCC